MADTAARARPRLFYGWWMAIAFGFLSMYTSGVYFYGFSAFFTPIKEQFGWSAAAVSVAFSLQRIEGGVFSPVVGWLFDKVGPRKIVLAGAAIFCIAFLLMSRVNSLVPLYLTVVLASMGHSGLNPSIGNATMAQWFKRHRAKAMGVILAGSGLSGLLVPVLVFIIDHSDWRTALVIGGIGVWAVAVPVGILMRHKPEQYGLLPDGDVEKPRARDAMSTARELGAQTARPEAEGFTVKEALRTHSFWLLALAFILLQLTISTTIVHVMPYLQEKGFARSTAGFVVSAITVTSILGRLGFAWCGDVFEKRFTLAITAALQAGGIFLFLLVHNVWTLIPFVATFAIGYGGGMPVRVAIQADYFGRKHFGSIQGVMGVFTAIAAVTSPFFAGVIKDHTKSYSLAFLILGVCTTFAIPLFLLLRAPSKAVAVVQEPVSSRQTGL